MFSHGNVLNWHMIDPRLQTLRVLRAQGTVTATAHALHLTPSTVSQQLRTLARDVGVDLLQPEGRRVRLTAAALTLLEHADVMHAQAERARADLAAHRRGEAGRLRLCGVSTAVAAILAPAAARLRDIHPRLAVHISEEESDDCFELLLADRTDIAVLIPTPDSPPATDTRFDQRPILDEPQDLLVPAAHPFAARENVELAESANEQWIIAPDRADQYQLLLAACAAAGFTPRIAHHAKEWTAISALVAYGFGVCLIPRLAPIPPEHAVARIPLTGRPAPSRRLIAYLRRGSDRQPPIAYGLEALHQAGTLPRTPHEPAATGDRGTADRAR
jgi:DNA-binding transcriptional LysR family regulator